MDTLLGQPVRSVYCSKYSSLMEATSNLSSDVKVLIVSCLGGIVASLAESPDSKRAIKKGMTVLGNGLFSFAMQRNSNIRIFVAPCTPRNSKDFSAHNKYAMVDLLSFLSLLELIS